MGNLFKIKKNYYFKMALISNGKRQYKQISTGTDDYKTALEIKKLAEDANAVKDHVNYNQLKAKMLEMVLEDVNAVRIKYETARNEYINRDLKPSSRRLYLDVFANLEKYIDKDGFLVDITSAQVANLLAQYKQNLMASTFSIRCGILNGFFNYCIAKGYTKEHIAKKAKVSIGKLKPSEDEKQSWTDDEVDKIENSMRSLFDLETVSVFRTLVQTGLRVDDVLTNLKKSNIDLEDGFVTIRTSKRQKDVTVKLSKELLEDLKEVWIKYPLSEKAFPQFAEIKAGYSLFLRRFYKAVDYAGIKVETYRSPSGELHRRKTIHSLRMRFGINALKRLQDPSLVMRLMGHRSYNSTAKYLRYSDQEVRDAATKLARQRSA